MSICLRALRPSWASYGAVLTYLSVILSGFGTFIQLLSPVGTSKTDCSAKENGLVLRILAAVFAIQITSTYMNRA